MTKHSILLATIVLLSLLTTLAHASTVTYVYTDPQGTPLIETDASGNVTAQFEYTPYGVPAVGAGPDGVGYTGHVNDPETGLVYMQARYYAPEVARFASVDPVGPVPGNIFSFNRYTYASGNPINRSDPTGMYACDTKRNANECEIVRKTLKEIGKAARSYVGRSPQAKALNAILKKYGTENDGNNISIVFGVIDSAGSTAQTAATGKDSVEVKFDFSSMKRYFGDFNDGKVEYAATFTHEGQHVVDTLARRRDPSPGPERFQTEYNAYISQSYINQAYGTLSPYRVWDPSWPTFARDGFRKWNAEKNANCDAYGCP
jgi:RHS repeat-associated protein